MPFITITEEKIPLIISLNGEPLNQSKFKRVKDSSTIIINNSNSDDNNIILLLIPTASQPQSLSSKFVEFKYYINIAATTRD